MSRCCGEETVFEGVSGTYRRVLLAVIGRSLRTRATAALLKGISLALLGAWVLGSAIYRVFVLGDPSPIVMGVVGTLALAVNVLSALLLLRYRNGDANVRSVWLCSRNDAIGNVAVLVAAAAVSATATAWPDLIVAAIMATLFVNASIGIVRQSLGELAEARAA